VQASLVLERLLLVVANDPWQKSPTRAVTPAEDRFAMTQALASDIPGAEASRMEIDRGGPSYTVVTAEEILQQAVSAGRPPPELFLVVGADLVAELPTWERVADLQRLVTLTVVSRPEAEMGPAPPGWRVRWVHGPQLHVSSSEVRAVLTGGGPVDLLLTAPVIHCIGRRDLYAVGR